MRRLLILCFVCLIGIVTVSGQETADTKKVYDESLDPVEQIHKGIEQARREGKNLVCQLGGNWCPWCLRFASFITADEEIRQFVDSNYVYIHVNVPRSREVNEAFDSLTHHASRFGFPVMLVYDADGTLLHIQDSVFLEEGKSYNKNHVMTFFKQWTCSAVKGVKPQR
ncbi:MAG: thioredoxin family protein [Prevotella sp.]